MHPGRFHMRNVTCHAGTNGRSDHLIPGHTRTSYKSHPEYERRSTCRKQGSFWQLSVLSARICQVSRPNTNYFIATKTGSQKRHEAGTDGEPPNHDRGSNMIEHPASKRCHQQPSGIVDAGLDSLVQGLQARACETHHQTEDKGRCNAHRNRQCQTECYQP